MKVAVVCLLVVTIAAVSVEGIIRNESRIIGNVRPGDRLLDRYAAFKDGKRGVVQVYNYQYPKFGGGAFISCIKVIDRWLNGTNGNLFVNSGGVGQKSVSLSIRSRLHYGLNYDIEIYGR